MNVCERKFSSPNPKIHSFMDILYITCFFLSSVRLSSSSLLLFFIITFYCCIASHDLTYFDAVKRSWNMRCENVCVWNVTDFVAICCMCAFFERRHAQEFCWWYSKMNAKKRLTHTHSHIAEIQFKNLSKWGIFLSIWNASNLYVRLIIEMSGADSERGLVCITVVPRLCLRQSIYCLCFLAIFQWMELQKQLLWPFSNGNRPILWRN